MTRPAMAATATKSRRLRSVLWEYLVALGLIAVLTAVGGVLQLLGVLDGLAKSNTPIWTVDLFFFAVTVLPFGLWLARGDRNRRGTLGKRKAGLAVVDHVSGGNIGQARAMLRNGIKLLPWQLGHMTFSRGMLTPADETTIAVLSTSSWVIVVVTVVLALCTSEGRALHDFGAGSRVIMPAGSPAGGVLSDT